MIVPRLKIKKERSNSTAIADAPREDIMKHNKSAACMLGLLAITMLPAAASNVSPKILAAVLQMQKISGHLLKIYDRQCDDLVRGNWSHWQDSMSPRFFVVTPDGRRESRKSLVENTLKVAQQITFTRCFATIHSVRRRGNVITVLVTNGSDSVAKSGDRPWKQTVVGDSIDTWILQGGRLLETSSIDTSGKIMVNGVVLKEFGPKKRGGAGTGGRH